MERDEPLNRRKYLGLTVLIFALVLSTFAIAYWLGLNQRPSFSAESRTEPSGRVTVIGYRGGSVFYNYTTHNMIMTIGSTYIRDFLGWKNETSTDATDDISLSADVAPDKAWTKLPNESSDLARASGDAVTAINSTAYQVEKTWTATGEVTVNCTGLHWSPVSLSDGNMLAAASISEVSLLLNDVLQVTWTVNIPDG